MPTQPGFVNLTSGPVTFGEMAVYRCNDSNQAWPIPLSDLLEMNRFTHSPQVMDGVGKFFSVKCEKDGTFDIPTTWPTCR